MDSELLTHWLRAMVTAMPRGGKSIAADMLGITPSGVSKILNVPDRAFDEKTIRALSWVQNSKSERFSAEEYPILKIVQVGPLIIEERKNPVGGPFFTWRKAL